MEFMTNDYRGIANLETTESRCGCFCGGCSRGDCHCGECYCVKAGSHPADAKVSKGAEGGGVWYPLLVSVLTLCCLVADPAWAQITFEDIATDPSKGLHYARGESDTAELYRAIRMEGLFTALDLERPPNKWRGAPGVALFDYDRDGDLDLYVANGPGRANGLFANQLSDTGHLTFVDVAISAGVAAVDHDSSGVCFGDTDNDGDDDLFVLSPFDANRLFENNGDGTFTDLTASSGLGNVETTSVACSFGDIDGDGLLDVVVANNTVDWSSFLGIGPTDDFLFNQHNELYRNTGGNTFEDVSETSGIRQLTSLPTPFVGEATATWAVAMVDLDLDGDLDILHADDQGGTVMEKFGGIDRGLLFYLENDGNGQFYDRTVEKGLKVPGGWMGLAFADLDCNGTLDFFATNIGDWGQTTTTPLDPVWADFAFYELGLLASRWFLGTPDGGPYEDPGVGGLVATEFGWGTSMFDYDNDADSDIIFHGGLMFPPFVNPGNPGTILNNDGYANMTYDMDALANSTNHARRVVQGMAVGDLNADGFDDVVSVSAADVQEEIPLFPYGVHWGSPIDGMPAYQRLAIPTGVPGIWNWDQSQPENVDGTLSVEINSADNGQRWLKVATVGTVGLVEGGAVNRSGIGAVVTVTPRHRAPNMRPVVGGASYASQDGLELTFGLGSKRRATVDILWPGGVRNRLYGAKAGERILFPEIPCSIDSDLSRRDFRTCVRNALDALVDDGVIEPGERGRFLSSAVRAHREY